MHHLWPGDPSAQLPPDVLRRRIKYTIVVLIGALAISLLIYFVFLQAR